MGNCFPCVVIDQGRMGILETLGKYSRILRPGLNCIIPCVQNVRYQYDMRQTQMKIEVSTKTHDNVFCDVEIGIFYGLKPAEVNDFAYQISDFKTQVESVVQDQGKIFIFFL